MDEWANGYLTHVYQIEGTDETACRNGFTYDWLEYSPVNTDYPPVLGPSGNR